MPVDKVHLKSIHEAVRYGDVMELQSMVQRGAGINDLDSKFKFTPLHWAAHHGALECLHWLLWHGADCSDTTPQGWTTAHLTAIRGQDACLQALAANGADLNAKDNRGCAPVHLAASHGNSYTLQSILRHGIDINAVDDMGWTAVHAAAFHGRLGCLQLLHRWGASVDDIDKSGNTPAHLSASEGHLPCLKFVICSSSSIDHALNARNDQGEMPKNLAQQFYKKDCVDYLNAVEYDLLHPESEENLAFPAHVAAYNGDLAHLRMLSETGVVSISERNDKGSTPAHKAAGNGQIEVLKWLVEQGADLTIVNSAGETPKDVARRFGKLACVALLGGDSDDEDNLKEDGIQEVIQEEPKTKAEARDLPDRMLKHYYTSDAEKGASHRNNSYTLSEAAQGRALRKIEELRHLMDISKMNYRQLGGELEEDIKRQEEERESARIIRELEAQLEYEREKREKMEAQMDKLRAQIHSLTVQLDEARSREVVVQRAPPPAVNTPLRRKKKNNNKRLNANSGVCLFKEEFQNQSHF